MNGNDNVGSGSNGNGAFPSTFFMWRITRRITRSLTQTNPSPRQRQQQRQVNRKPSKNTTGHRHTARAAVQRAATNSRPRPHPRHTPTLIAASASGHSYKERLSVATNNPAHFYIDERVSGARCCCLECAQRQSSARSAATSRLDARALRLARHEDRRGRFFLARRG